MIQNNQLYNQHIVMLLKFIIKEHTKHHQKNILIKLLMIMKLFIISIIETFI